MESNIDTNTPPIDKHNDSDSLDAWINRAKRARELLHNVELDKIMAHDALEIAKVAKVSDALGDISQGRDVDHLPGVDAPIIALDPALEHKAKLLALLADNGFADSVGRILCLKNSNHSVQPIEIIPHTQGLPEFDLCLAPQNADGEGSFGLFISADSVFGAFVLEPATANQWQVANTRTFTNLDELLLIITEFATAAFA